MSLSPAVSERDHQRGPASSPVTLVEYGDYQCPHCAQAHPILQELQRRFGTHLRLVFRNFPLTEVHPHAAHAAEAGECVAAHGGEEAFWRMHDTMFERQSDSRSALADERLVEYGAAAGVDPAVVARHLESGAHEGRVREDLASGIRSGMNGTPTFFVNGSRYDGGWTDVDSFAAVLGRAAKEAKRMALHGQ